MSGLLPPFALLGPPLFPEAVRLFRFAVSGPTVGLDVKRVSPAGVIRTPSDKTMEPRIRFIIGAYRDTECARRVASAPIHATCFRIDGPLQYPTRIGDIVGSCGPFADHDRLGRAFLRANLAGRAELSDTKVNGFIRHKGQVGNHIV